MRTCSSIRSSRHLSKYISRRRNRRQGIRGEPSELAKLGLLLVLAHVLSTDRSPGTRLLWAVGLWALPTGLTLLQPDLSTAMLLTAVVGSAVRGTASTSGRRS